MYVVDYIHNVQCGVLLQVVQLMKGVGGENLLLLFIGRALLL